MNAASVYAGLAAATLMALVLAVTYWPNLRAWLDERIACKHQLADLHDVFPDDTEPWPGCQCTVRWDNNADRAVWTTCGQCAQPVGKHAAPWSGGSLDNQQPEVILAIVTDVQKRRQQ